MAKRNVKWAHSVFQAPSPYLLLGSFQAGTTQAVDESEFLELSSGNFVPLATDKAMAGTVSVSVEEIFSGDLAGYYPVVVPRPGDVFECDLASGADDTSPDRANTVYVSGDDEVTTTDGTNVFGAVVDHDGFPRRSGHASRDASISEGTTIGSANGKVLISIKEGASYFNQLFLDDA